MFPRVSTVLFAEDDPNDAYLVQRAFKKAELEHRLVHVIDGQHALDYLTGAPPYEDRSLHPLPALLLLDIKMPRLTGFEVLQYLQHKPGLNTIPAVVLSSSDYEKDIALARHLGAVAYFRKPSDPAELLSIVKTMDERWLKVAA